MEKEVVGGLEVDEWKAEKRKHAVPHEWPPCLNNPYFIQLKGSHMPKWEAASLGAESVSLTFLCFVFWLLSWLHYFRPQSPHSSHSFLPPIFSILSPFLPFPPPLSLWSFFLFSRKEMISEEVFYILPVMTSLFPSPQTSFIP